MKILIRPEFNDAIGSEGGIRRVVEAQKRWLPTVGWELTDDVDDADVIAVHATTWVPCGNKPVVTHCHGLYWSEYPWPRWGYKANDDVIACILKSDLCTAPTQWVANAIRRGTQCDARVVPHGIELDVWVPGGSRGYVLWNKTRVDPVCDPRPVNAIANMCSDVQFVTTFGEDAQNVQIIGVDKNADHRKWVQDAAIYLCTARETFGIGTLEALACGVPVVGWDWGGQREFLTREAGLLVQPGDYAGLQRAIYYVMQNRDKFSSGARQLAERYSWENVIKLYAQLYQEVVDTQPKKRVSVVMPSYNLGSYLKEAIDSVVGQLGPEDELIVVDDCSTDGSYELAKGFETAPSVSVVRTPSNLYLAGALNYGVGLAQGRYILPLDADNMLDRGAIATLASQLDAERDLDVAYGKIKFVNADGSIATHVSGDGISGWPPAVANVDQQLMHKNQIPSTSMYRKKWWTRLGGYRRRCRTAEDADFWCRVLMSGAKGRRVTEAVTLIYRDRVDSMSRVEQDWPWELWYQQRGWPGTSTVGTYEPVTVSVVIPVGPGHEEIVVDALDSISNQSLSNWECIVVDDSHQIKWLPSWVRYYRTDRPGSGTAMARNIGISRCRGTSFVLLDADDYLDRTCLEKMHSVLDGEHYVYSDFYRQEDHKDVHIEDFDCEDMIRILKHPVTCMYPIAVRDKVQFDPSFVVGEDWDYVIGVLKAGYCGIRVSESLMYYRQNSGGNRKQLLSDLHGVGSIRQKIRDKWGDKMGCGCSSHQAPLSQPGLPGALQSAMNSDLVLVEYVLDGRPPLTYRGQVTGTEYRFGSDEGHKKRYVHRADAQVLIERPEFALATQ